MENKGEIILYDPQKEGENALQVKLYDDTVWLSQAQIGELFEKARSTITEHINNIFHEGELEQDAVCREFRHTASDGKQYSVKYYNLDVIISIGYRVQSQKGTQFRIWATKVLKDHLIQGFSLNKRVLEENQQRLTALQKSMSLIQKAADRKDLHVDQAKALLDLISSYTKSFTLLNEYDTNSVPLQKQKKSVFILDYDIAANVIDKLKADLAGKEEASDLFGNEIEDRFKAILGSVYQSLYGKEVYASLEEKSAHLLYFIIKDHPFSDGNKRIASMLFIYFLEKNNFLYKQTGEVKINDNTLVALALLVAESNPYDKEIIIKVITNLLI